MLFPIDYYQKLRKNLDDFREEAKQLILDSFPNYKNEIELAVLEENIARSLFKVYRFPLIESQESQKTKG